MTRDEVTRLLAFLAEAYPNTRAPANPDDRIDTWHVALCDEPAGAIYEAARVIVLSDEFHPSVARCMSVMVTGSTESGVFSRLRVRRHLEERALGEAAG